MLRYIYIALFCGALAGACSVGHTEYRQVACSFAEELNRCLSEGCGEGHKKLFNYCSAYTYSLSRNPVWAMRIVPQGLFRYTFVRDSLSVDKMRAYVWFSNAFEKLEISPEVASATYRQVYCLELRQSFNGWLVDMPLF